MARDDRQAHQMSSGPVAVRLVNVRPEQEREVARWRAIYEQLVEQQSLPAIGLPPWEE